MSVVPPFITAIIIIKPLRYIVSNTQSREESQRDRGLRWMARAQPNFSYSGILSTVATEVSYTTDEATRLAAIRYCQARHRADRHRKAAGRKAVLLREEAAMATNAYADRLVRVRGARQLYASLCDQPGGAHKIQSYGRRPIVVCTKFAHEIRAWRAEAEAKRENRRKKTSSAECQKIHGPRRYGDSSIAQLGALLAQKRTTAIQQSLVQFGFAPEDAVILAQETQRDLRGLFAVTVRAHQQPIVEYKAPGIVDAVVTLGRTRGLCAAALSDPRLRDWDRSDTPLGLRRLLGVVAVPTGVLSVRTKGEYHRATRFSAKVSMDLVGVEIEACVTAKKASNGFLAPISWIVESDSSIRPRHDEVAAEFITPPRGWKTTQKQIVAWSAKLEAEGWRPRGGSERVCGLHVTSAMPSAGLHKLQHYLSALPKNVYKKLTGRKGEDSYDYASPRTSGKYSALHVRRSSGGLALVEMRMFTCAFDSMAMRIAATQALFALSDVLDWTTASEATRYLPRDLSMVPAEYTPALEWMASRMAAMVAALDDAELELVSA